VNPELRVALVSIAAVATMGAVAAVLATTDGQTTAQEAYVILVVFVMCLGVIVVNAAIPRRKGGDR
jgi:hypothetical protein